jgi:hypothetical protein
VETTANAQLATVKHVAKAAVLAAPLAVPSVPGAASAKGAQTSAAAVPETHSSMLGEILGSIYTVHESRS